MVPKAIKSVMFIKYAPKLELLAEMMACYEIFSLVWEPNKCI